MFLKEKVVEAVTVFHLFYWFKYCLPFEKFRYNILLYEIYTWYLDGPCTKHSMHINFS